jgi:stringent starvation protein B
MSAEDPATTSTKPYLIRAIYEWILDNGMTPHLVVDADFPGTEVPREFVEDGQIVLNVAPGAVRELVIGNDWTSFNARFSGTVRNLLLPTEAVLGIVTRESRQGMVFPDPAYPQAPDQTAGQTSGQPTIAAVPHQTQPQTGGPPTRPRPGAKDKGKGKGPGGPTLKVVK